MYKALFSIFATYWREYGGKKELLNSPFFHLAALATILFGNGLLEFDWRNFALDAFPTILGLSLAAYAITFSLMGSALHRALTIAVDKRRGLPLVNIVNATFFHVLVFQVLTLVFAVSTRGTAVNRLLRLVPLEKEASDVIMAYIYRFGEITGFFLTTYSLLLLLSVGIAMYRLGRLNPKQDLAPEDIAPTTVTNDNGESENFGREITGTVRFKILRRLAKVMRLYDDPR